MKHTKNILYIANWKTNPVTSKEAVTLYKGLLREFSLYKQKLIICPPSLFIPILSKEKGKNIQLGLQNTIPQDKGAFTGQVSLAQAKEFKIGYVIVGHSEVRLSGDTDEVINQKIKYILKNKLTPILCVGEKKRDEGHEYFSFIENQIKNGLAGISKNNFSNVIIAYEPLWAIGSTAKREATPDEFYEIKIFIRKIIQDVFGVKGSQVPHIIYGGSVDEKNAKLFIEEGSADGLLIGRVSLDVKKMTQLIKSVE